MKFLFHFYDLHQRAGIQRAISELANALVEESHQVIVATNSPRSEAAYNLDDRVIVVQTPYAEYRNSGLRAWLFKTYWALRQWGVLRRIAMRHQPDLIVDHGTALGLLFPFRQMGRTPFVLQRHFPAKTFPNGRLLYPILSILNGSKTIIVLTDGIAAEMKDMGFRRVSVIPNPIPADATATALPQSEPKIGLLMGRSGNPQKGFDLFLKALGLVSPQGWYFVIVGPGVESDAELLELRQKYNLTERVELLPATSKPYEWIRKCSCLIMPSRYEALPMVALEALSIGRPIIASDADGLREVVINGVNGVIFPREDIESLACCLSSFCQDSDRLRALAGRASDSVQKFQRRRIVERWLEFASELNER